MSKLIKKTIIDNNSKKYDIETEKHNYFANNILVHNCTGDDITENVKKMNFVPQKLVDDFTGDVRGEVLLSRKNKKKYFPEFKNCRNGASGVMKHLDGAGCEHLDVVCYDAQYYSKTEEFGTQQNLVSFLERNGFKAAEYRFFKNLTGKAAMDYLKEVFDDFDNLEYDAIAIVAAIYSIVDPKLESAIQKRRDE